jgi:TP901 family phage tail tape measure protein
MSTVIESVEFRATSPRRPLPGLDDTLRKLEALNAALKRTQAQLTGLSSNAAFKLNARQYQRLAYNTQGQSVLNVNRLGRQLGFPDTKDIRRFAQLQETEIQSAIGKVNKAMERAAAQNKTGQLGKTAGKRYRDQIVALQMQSYFADPSAREFKNPTQAGRFYEKYAGAALKDKARGEAALRAILSGTVPAQAGGAAAPPYQAVPQAVPVAAAPAKQTPRAAMAAAARAREAAGIGGVVDDGKGGLMETRVITDRKGERQVTRRRTGEGQTTERVTEGGEDIRTTLTNKIEQRLRKQLTTGLGSIEQQYRADLPLASGTAQGVRDLKAQAIRQARSLYQSNPAFAQLGMRGMVTEFAGETLPAATQKQMVSEGRQLARLRQAAARAKAKDDRGEQTRIAGQVKEYEGRQSRYEAMQGLARGGGSGGSTAMILQQATMAQGDVEHHERVAKEEAAARKAAGRKPPENRDRLSSALGGLNVRDTAANFIKVAAWSAAAIPVYGAMYKALELVNYSMTRLENTGMAMAHLSIIFRGVGGSVNELTADTIRLAAAQGRSTDEAMESATEWARLGGTRKEVNEEVRVSAMAANIAGISMLETTKQLSALMHIYHLRAADLNGVLGMLTNTSLKYNVTLDELFIGLDRSAAAAKVAGLGLSELQAIIGVVVGATGQTGSMTGNSIKYILQTLAKGDVQKQLRGYGVEALTNKLEQKPAGQTLAELSGVWGTLGRRQQTGLSNLLGGRFNAARVPIVMENYPRVLQLAIDGQLNLNKAQESNVKILDTLKAQLAGLKAAWDKLVMDSNIMPGLTKWTRVGKNILTDIDNNHGITPATPEAERKRIQDYMATGNPVARFGQSLMRSMGLVKHPGVNSSLFAKFTGPLGLGVDKNTPGLVDIYNQAHLTPDELGAIQVDPAQKLKGQAEAHRKQVMAMQLAAKTLENGSMTAEQANIHAAIMNQAGGNGRGFLAARGRGDTAGALRIVHEAEAKAAAKAMAAEATVTAIKKATLTKHQSELDALVTKQTAAEKRGGSGEEQRAGIEEHKRLIEEDTKSVEDNVVAEEQLAGEMENVRITQQQYISALKIQGEVVDSIAKKYSALGQALPTQELVQQAAMFKEQLRFLEEARRPFNPGDAAFVKGGPNDTVEGVAANIQMLAEIKKVQAAYDAAASAPARAEAAQREEWMRGVRTAENRATAADAGIDPTEKLLNKRKALTEDLARTEEGSAQHYRDQNLIYETNLELARRRADVEREIKQLAIDQNREFTRSFFGSGPAEMLRKLAAFKMAQGGGSMSQGGFFSMGTGMRQDYGMLHPEFNPEMILLRNERNRNRGVALPDYAGDSGGRTPAGRPVPRPRLPDNWIDTRTSGERAQDGLKARMGITDINQYSWGKDVQNTRTASGDLSPKGGEGGERKGNLDEFAPAVVNASKALDGLTSSANAAAEGLNRIAEIVKNIPSVAPQQMGLHPLPNPQGAGGYYAGKGAGGSW